MVYTFKMEENEYWWGGTTVDGPNSPFDNKTELSHDFRIDCPNQTMPLYLSTHGRCIWSENAFGVKIKNGEFIIDGEDVTIEKFGETLKEAYVCAMNKYFPPSGEELAEEFFRLPQYNTWIELTYNQTQEGVMKYAREIIENGFKPGILIIDEGWHKDYGIWEFDLHKFPNPRGMTDELHKMGFKVMLWVCPHVRPDGLEYCKKIMECFNPSEYDKVFLRNEKGEVAISSWWNGNSAMYDFTKECDYNCFDNKLKALMEDYGIDGFKFDGGTVEHYNNSLINGEAEKSSNQWERNKAWNDLGIRYKFHEYKDTYKGGGRRMIQRIRDRAHSWDGDGLDTLIPNALLQGITGHPFVCPDMIGGGEWTIKDLDLPADEELFVRMAQCSALFPMMQFSWSPWSALSEENLKHVKSAHDLHIEFASIFMELVGDAYKNGEPIIRALDYNFPKKGYEKITDEFMLGDDILIAPVLKKGATEREVILPQGRWRGFNGEIYEGGKTVTVKAEIDVLPYFFKM